MANWLRKRNRQDWDKIFRFFAKYTDEITSVEDSLANKDRRLWSALGRGDYLRSLKGDLQIWVRVMRDFHFPDLGAGLTEEQKKDILRRFDELKKYMTTPPHFPGGKAVEGED